MLRGHSDPPETSLLYFQLEWAMKLWWPHSEAMIAFLMGYSDSGDPALLQLFCQVAEYTFRQVRAASWSISLYELSKGVEETTGCHSSPDRPGAGFPGL